MPATPAAAASSSSAPASESSKKRDYWTLSREDKHRILLLVRDQGPELLFKPTELFTRLTQVGVEIPEGKTQENFQSKLKTLRENLLAGVSALPEKLREIPDVNRPFDFETACLLAKSLPEWQHRYKDPKLALEVAQQVWREQRRRGGHTGDSKTAVVAGEEIDLTHFGKYAEPSLKKKLRMSLESTKSAAAKRKDEDALTVDEDTEDSDKKSVEDSRSARRSLKKARDSFSSSDDDSDDELFEIFRAKRLLRRERQRRSLPGSKEKYGGNVDDRLAKLESRVKTYGDRIAILEDRLLGILEKE